MQLDLQVIDGFRGIAHYLAFAVSEAGISENSFVGAKILLMPDYKITDDELVCVFSDRAEIGFKNIVPNKILSIQVDPNHTK